MSGVPSRPIAIYLRTADGSLVQFDSVRRLRRWFRDGRIQGADLISVDGITWLGAHDQELVRILGDLEGEAAAAQQRFDSKPTYHSIARQVRFDTRPRLERHKPAVDKRPTQPSMPAASKEKEEAWFEHGESGLLSRQIFLQANAQRARRNSRLVALASFALIGAAVTLVVLWELDRVSPRMRLGVIDSTPIAQVDTRSQAPTVMAAHQPQTEPAREPAMVGGPATPAPPSPEAPRMVLADEMAVAAAVAQLSDIERGTPEPLEVDVAPAPLEGAATVEPAEAPEAPAASEAASAQDPSAVTTDDAPTAGTPGPRAPEAAVATAEAESAAVPAPASPATPPKTAASAKPASVAKAMAPSAPATPRKTTPAPAPPVAKAAPAPSQGLGDLSRFDIDALMRLGHQATRRGRHDRAVSVYSEALTRKPGRVEVHYQRAMALLRLGSASRARAAFQRCSELSAAYAPCRYGAARALEALGQASDAITAYRVYLARYPNSSQVSSVERRLERLGAQ